MGSEKEKLEAALRWGMKRALVASDTDLSPTDIEDFRRRGLEVV